MSGKVNKSYMSDKKIREVHNGKLDKKIRCSGCGDRKPATEFSNRRPFGLKRQRHSKVPFSSPGIHCRQCTGIQANYLKCSVCDQTLDLRTAFSYTQRSYAAKPRCKDCVKEQEGTGPPELSEPEDGSDEDDYCVRVSGSVNDEYDTPPVSNREEFSSAFQNLTLEAHQGDILPKIPRGALGAARDFRPRAGEKSR